MAEYACSPLVPPKNVGGNCVASTWMSKQAQSNHGRASVPIAIFIINSRGCRHRPGRPLGCKGFWTSKAPCPGEAWKASMFRPLQSNKPAGLPSATWHNNTAACSLACLPSDIATARNHRYSTAPPLPNSIAKQHRCDAQQRQSLFGSR